MKFLFIFLLPLYLFSKEITISVIAVSGLAQSVKEWKPTIDYLQNALPQYTFHLLPIEPHDTDKLKRLIREEKIDFIITQPAIYIELELDLGVSRILTIIKQGGLAEFGSVLITQKSSNIHKLQDMKGKRISAVAALGFGGWLIAYNELIKEGIDPLADDNVFFEGTQTKVVKAIIKGKSDVGVIRTGILEKLHKHGFKGLDDLRVINARRSNAFPYALSTNLYPEWALAKSEFTSNETAKKIALVLLSIRKNSKAAQSASYEAWSFPYNYQPVHELMKDLRIGVYKDYGKMTVKEIFYEYKYIFFALILLFALLIGFLLYSRSMNRKLQRKQAEKNEIFSQLETVFNLQLSLLLVVEKGRVIRVNDAFLQFLKLPSLDHFLEEYGMLENLFEYVDNDDYISTKKYGESWIELLYKNINDKKHYKVKMGHTIFSINAKQLPLDTHSYIVMLRDITYIEDHEAFLESQIDMAKNEIIEKQRALFAQSKLASMGEMIGVIAHQLKQPLSTISSLNNSLLMSLMLEEFKVDKLEKVLNKESESIELMSQTIDDFRTFFSPNKVQKSFTLDHCIKSVLSLLTPILQKNNITINYEADRSIKLLSLENELFHVLMNIINNAKDALIEINTQKPHIDIKSYSNGETVTILIEDNAGGIEEAIIDKIFDQYFTTKDDTGTGIGLYLSKLIIEDSLGGSLEVCNGSQGALFTITL